MSEPTLRIFVSPTGVLKVDAPVQDGNEQRDRTYEFCQRIFGAIRNLDKEVRLVRA